MLRNREKVINMKKGKKQAKRRNANVTMAFGIQGEDVLCFLVPVLFMIVLGIISYRKAADGMSSSYRDSTQQTIEMALQNIDTSNSFISAEALNTWWIRILESILWGFTTMSDVQADVD